MNDNDNEDNIYLPSLESKRSDGHIWRRQKENMFISWGDVIEIREWESGEEKERKDALCPKYHLRIHTEDNRYKKIEGDHVETEGKREDIGERERGKEREREEESAEKNQRSELEHETK